MAGSLPALPPWLHKKLRGGQRATEECVKQCGLCTVCEESMCPNMSECYREGRATFLLLGPSCTRSCAFCNVSFSTSPLPPNEREPQEVASCAATLRLCHVVLTMVTRDDLADGGAGHLVKTIRAVRQALPEATVEVLTSDFGGSSEAVDTVLCEKPEVFAHNVETVRSLSARIRCRATYDGSLAMLASLKEKDPAQVTKSGIMVGLGEADQEVKETIRDLRDAGIDIMTIGQYLQATGHHVAVKEWVPPEMFQEYELYAKESGIQEVVAGPFVRSSYRARPLQTPRRRP